MTNDLGYRLIHLPEVDSTNRYLRDLPQEDEEMTVAVTDFQTEGRGQRGNIWNSQPGVNLLFSVRLFPTFLGADKQFLLSQIMSLALKRVLDRYVHEVTIKWPNDIYWHDQKLCGILIEHDLQNESVHRTIIGVGINVNQATFEGATFNPVSMRMITGGEVDREQLLHRIMKVFLEYYAELQEGKTDTIAARYHESLYRRFVKSLFTDAQGDFYAVIDHVDPDGRLVLRDEEGKMRRYTFKEIKFK